MIDRLRECGLSDLTYIDNETVTTCVRPEELSQILRCLILRAGLHFSTCVGVDVSGLGEQGIEIYYIVSGKKLRILLKTRVAPSEKIEVPLDLPCTYWCLHEARDLVGLNLRNEVYTYRFVLPDSYPRSVCPLRKDYQYSERPLTKCVQEVPTRPEKAITLFPHIPYFYEHEDFIVYVDGDKIVDFEYRGFYNHRGIEKVGETRLKADQVPFIAERICGICGYTHSCAYCQAVESALRVDIPESARLTRTLLLEVERIESHLLWLAILCYMINLRDLFLKLMRCREHVMSVGEILTGNRKMYGINVIGGVRDFITSERIEKAARLFSELKTQCTKLLQELKSSERLRAATRGVGTLSREDALITGAVGPVARASGIDYDVRKYLPYAAYSQVSFSIPVYSEGDVYSRALVRIDETLESIDIIDQVLGMSKALLEKPHRSEYEWLPCRVGVGMTEAPRGEDVHFVITGHDLRLYRWRVRAPTYANLPSLWKSLIGEKLEHANLIIASIDPCLACTDRLVVIDAGLGKVRKITRLVEVREA